MNKPAQRLKMLLRVVAVATSLALIAVFLPRATMASIHEWLGLGPFPPGPLADYLARSLSAFYAMAAVLLWLVSYDLERYRPVITYLAVAGLAFAVLIVMVDLQLHLPWWWTVGEGLVDLSISLGILWLQRQAKA